MNQRKEITPLAMYRNSVCFLKYHIETGAFEKQRQEISRRIKVRSTYSFTGSKGDLKRVKPPILAMEL